MRFFLVCVLGALLCGVAAAAEVVNPNFTYDCLRQEWRGNPPSITQGKGTYLYTTSRMLWNRQTGATQFSVGTVVTTDVEVACKKEKEDALTSAATQPGMVIGALVLILVSDENLRQGLMH